MQPVRRRSNRGAFRYSGGELFCDGVSLQEVANAAGTPAFVYSSNRIISRYREFDRALGSHPHMICYSVKANGNLHLLRLLARQGSAFDIVSGGELYRVLQAGGRANRVVFSGVGKTEEEIDYALRSGILLFNCESESELRLLSERAVALGTRARAALRINPHVEARTHRHITTGLNDHKFGIEMNAAQRLYREAQGWPGLRVVGLSCHIGSQMYDLGPLEKAVRKMTALAGRLHLSGMPVQFLDVGGGLAVAYRPEDTVPTIAAYGSKILRCVRGIGLKLLVEPGRAVVADAAVLLTRVIRTKTTGRKKFVIVDSAMNDLLRPSLYDAFHEIRPVVRSRRKENRVDVVGPVCETGDYFARDRLLPEVEPGDLLAVLTTGAYGFVLSSNYNARPRAAEILVKGTRWQVTRRRETLRDLLRHETQDRILAKRG